MVENILMTVGALTLFGASDHPYVTIIGILLLSVAFSRTASAWIKSI